MLKEVALMVGCIALLSGNAMASGMHGKALYEKSCAACHGMDGKVSDVGKKLKPYPARDLTALSDVVDRDELRRIIAYGIRGTAMVPKKYDLDSVEIEDVIDYIFTFKRKINMEIGRASCREIVCLYV